MRGLINGIILAVCACPGSFVLKSLATPVVVYDNDVPHRVNMKKKERTVKLEDLDKVYQELLKNAAQEEKDEKENPIYVLYDVSTKSNNGSE